MSAILFAARAFDRGEWEQGLERLRAAPLVASSRSERMIAAALWKRVLSNYPQCAKPSAAFDQGEANRAFEVLTAGAKDQRRIWDAYRQLPVLEKALGAGDAASIVAAVLWDRVLESEPAVFNTVLELFFKGGRTGCAAAWEQYLSQNKAYVPGYWLFVLYASSLFEHGHADPALMTLKSLKDIQREDLALLYEVYLKQMRQAPMCEIASAARMLAAPGQRLQFADSLLGMSYMVEDIRLAAPLFVELVGISDSQNPAVAMMQMRLATAERRWTDVLELGEIAANDERFRIDVKVASAHALARLNETTGAALLLKEVAADSRSSPYQQARATFVGVSVELARLGLQAHDERGAKIFAATPGRPLAQSLWVGAKLRWIEQLAIKSFLDNGWRFQLYVYDDLENVPPGCEVLDASAIIPAKDVFREGAGSGMHAGSVGAFSDLFRYKLLYERGGMWTDTDVINLQKFDPDGEKFVSTEINDAGIISLNGALMAAPAGDGLMARAYERAREILNRRDQMFFTRIGPYLLAELVLEHGVDEIEFMAPGFLSPISWMNTGSLLHPYADVTQQPRVRDAVNLHVYTETWRILGLGLDRPPGADTFLGALYERHCGEVGH